jgi:hypothetical protein
MAIITTNMSPFDAVKEVTFDPDCRSARVNRFGIGFGQRGYAGNKHYPTIETAEAAFEAMIVDLRRVYGTPGRNWTGKFIEEEMEINPGTTLLRRVRFVPLLKSGKQGKTIHTIYLYPIEVSAERIEAIGASLKIPVS